MICMNCGAAAGNEERCPSCGSNLKLQKKACRISAQYYNQGLDKAQIRDLSGAIDLLRRSLKYNKRNVDARNLLGLVYFETGEAVSALSEWIISKNIRPEDNIANAYIQRLQAEQPKLDIINQTIKRYNVALQCCREGHEDIAAVQLRKLLQQNPKLIKAYHLLALIYIKDEDYEKARKILKKASRIDKTNSTTLRFLKEIDAQTGTVTSLDGRQYHLWKKGDREEKKAGAVPQEENWVITPGSYRETSSFSMLINLLVGLGIGILVAGFLVVPAAKRAVNRTADEKILSYSTQLVEKDTRIAALEEEISKLNDAVDEADESADSANEKVTDNETVIASYQNLLQAFQLYSEGDPVSAVKYLNQVDEDLLSSDAKKIMSGIRTNLKEPLFQYYYEQGSNYYQQGDYTNAIKALKKAMKQNEDDYYTLSYLAHAYRMTEQKKKSIEIFEKIVEKFPDTRRALVAQQYIDQLEAGNTDGSVDESLVADEVEAEEAAAAAQAQAEAEAQAAYEAYLEELAAEEASAAAEADGTEEAADGTEQTDQTGGADRALGETAEDWQDPEAAGTAADENGGETYDE